MIRIKHGMMRTTREYSVGLKKIRPQTYFNGDEYRGNIQCNNGFWGRIKRPSEAGRRVLMLHVGNENDFLPECG